MQKKLLLATAGAAPGLLALAGTATAAPITTPPSDCNAPLDTYAYTAGALSACSNIRTFPKHSAEALPGGGFAEDYEVDGALIRYYTPPAGFDAVHATDAQLKAYGLPPRPTDPTALALWQKAMGKLKPVTPPPFLAELSGVQADSVDTPNWSGYTVSGSSGTYQSAAAEWQEPTYGASACSGASSVVWAGVGGYAPDPDIGQDGTAFGLRGMQNHQTWTEVYPVEDIIPQALVIPDSQDAYASASWQGNGWHFFIENENSGASESIDDFHALYTGGSAEAIVERPSINNVATPLANFGTMEFFKSAANGTTLEKYSPNGVRHGLHMFNTQTGHDLADPSTIDLNGDFFDTQNHCN